MISEFRKFVLRGNVIDLAVAVVIGAAFTAIINSLVNDIINPLIGLLLGGVDLSNIFVVLRDGVPPGPYQTLADAVTAGAVTLNVGNLLNAIINFLIVALVLFLIIKALNKSMELARLKAKEAPAAPPPPDPVLESQKALTESIEKLTATLEKTPRI
ncbi:MAG TPA: large conductance mechanosensitive channel protein MscL [Candidatus Limnocylindrales bacterium]|nr:large conductance mechanosensitive channel protein MscL [Candidatus Limnocylindrales bacterium]